MIPCVTNFLLLKSYAIFFCKKFIVSLKIKTSKQNFLHMYKFIPSGNRFSIILSNRTSEYTRDTRGGGGVH